MTTKLAALINSLTKDINDPDERLWIKTTRQDAITWRKRLRQIERGRNKDIPIPSVEEIIERIAQFWDGDGSEIDFEDGDFGWQLHRDGEWIFNCFYEQQRKQENVAFCESRWRASAMECEGGWITIMHRPSRKVRTFDAKSIATAIRWMSMAESLHQSKRRQIQDQIMSGRHGRVGLLF